MSINDKLLIVITNIQYIGCIGKNTSFLHKVTGIRNWNGDTANKNKILTLHSGVIEEMGIIRKVKEFGIENEKL